MQNSAQPNPQIKDFVTVRDCPTVVRFSDLSTQNNQWISQNYFLNEEIKAHLKAIEQCFAKEHGCGIFLIGSYGTGKSHFLAYLIQQMQARKLSPAPENVFYLSLLDYASHGSLEDIISKKLGIKTDDSSRSAKWSFIQEKLSGGILLVMDELSEFLRSKPSSQAFTEDIRFLQFLGEWAQGESFWLLAAMQEQIEHTGDLEYSLYRKIKDRFPLRLLLSATHFSDLLSNHLLIKNENYSVQVEQLANRWLALYPDHKHHLLQIKNYYPLHPATLTLMEEVRDGFSQTRGMVEFVIRQMGGDDAGRITPFVNRHWGELLSPDFIIDHFQDLFELQPEFLPLSQKLFPYYRENLDKLFPNPLMCQLAKRLIKLLVLTYLSPGRTHLSLEDACFWLLISVSQLQPEKNTQIIHKIFTILHEQGHYIEKKPQGYYLDLKQDIGIQFDKQLSHYLTDLPQSQQILLEEAFAGLSSSDFPLLQLEQNRWQQRQINWHFHPRQFWVCFGELAKAPDSGLALHLRLPWEQNDVKSAKINQCFTLQPKPINAGDELRTMVALQRMSQQTLSEAVSKRVLSQLQNLRNNFITQLHNAYLQAALYDKEGLQLQFNVGNLHRIDQFLEQIALTLLKRTYPGFERFAPSHGSLSKTVYIDLMDFAENNDLLQEDAIDTVKLIREAYWLPMGLIRRQGKQYKVTPQLENHQLIKRLQPLLNHEPSPSLILEDFSEPILGMVEDQVNLLLIFLLLQGEIEITRQQQPYQTLFETFPNPLQYDRVCFSYGLDQTESEQLQTLTKALEIPQPKQWTSLTQKQIIIELQDHIRQRLGILDKTSRQLQELAQNSPLVNCIHHVSKQWRPLLENTQPIPAWQQFIFELEPLPEFINKDKEAMSIVDCCQKLFNETKRYIYLLSRLKNLVSKSDSWGEDLTEKFTSLKRNSWQSSPQNWQRWLQDCRQFYDNYSQIYHQAHNDWWDKIDRDFEQWSSPPLSRLEILGLQDTLIQITKWQQQSQQLACLQCTDLTYQPLCQCGFNFNEQSHTELDLQGGINPICIQTDCQALINHVEKELLLYFSQKNVHKRMQEWKKAGLETTPQLISYLEGKAELPFIQELTIKDLAALNNWLAGIELIKSIPVEELQLRLLNKNWKLPKLLSFLSDYLTSYQQTSANLSEQQPWLRFTKTKKTASDSLEIMRWTLKQCLKFGQDLPDFINNESFEFDWEKYFQAEWVTPTCLQNFHLLNYPQALEDIILKHIWDGSIPYDQRGEHLHPLIRLTTQHLTQPVELPLNQLIKLTDSSYSYHFRMRKVIGSSWGQHLNALSKSNCIDKNINLETKLNALIEQYPTAQFIIIDALSCFILPSLLSSIEQALPHWQLTESSNASLTDPTTTSSCYDLLQQQTNIKKFKKINSLDELIHQQYFALNLLAEKAAVDIKHRLSQLITKANPRDPIILFADHGFRLHEDGQHYTHGGNTWLENIVPILTFLPKG